MIASYIKYCLWGAAASFLAMTSICMVRFPEIFQHASYGISFFGTVPANFIPYNAGFALTILCIAGVARQLQPATRPLSVIFWALAICMSGIAVTSYSMDHVVYATHWGFAIALVICILAAVFWLIRQGGLARLDYVLIVLILATVTVSALPIVNHIPVVKVYIPRELLVFVCSLWLLGRAALKRTTSTLVG